MTPLAARIAADGPAAHVPDEERGAPDAAFVAAKVRAALAARDAAAAVALWDEAGRRHDPTTLDAALADLTAGGWIPVIGATSKRRLRLSARAALAGTRSRGTVELAAAVLGAAGDASDADRLEPLARHPAFVLHAVTALANLEAWQGRAALLRLLTTTTGADRVTVIDRLLAHLREPAVRLALVRDALTGLDAAHAVEVAPDIARLCDVEATAADEKAPEALRAGARAVLLAARQAPPPA